MSVKTVENHANHPYRSKVHKVETCKNVHGEGNGNYFEGFFPPHVDVELRLSYVVLCKKLSAPFPDRPLQFNQTV